MNLRQVKPMKDEYNRGDFARSFSKDQKDCIWQYFLDHSQLQRNGYWGIMFYIRDWGDFMDRLYARYTGEFSRYDKLEKQHVQDNCAFYRMKAMARYRDEVVREITSSGSLREKLLLKLYRFSRDRLFK